MFHPIEMPSEFGLECLNRDGSWVLHGIFRAEEFDRQPDGAYLNAKEGLPTWLRCLRQDGQIVYSVDGGGDPHTYRLCPAPRRLP